MAQDCLLGVAVLLSNENAIGGETAESTIQNLAQQLDSLSDFTRTIADHFKAIRMPTA